MGQLRILSSANRNLCRYETHRSPHREMVMTSCSRNHRRGRRGSEGASRYFGFKVNHEGCGLKSGIGEQALESSHYTGACCPHPVASSQSIGAVASCSCLGHSQCQGRGSHWPHHHGGLCCVLTEASWVGFVSPAPGLLQSPTRPLHPLLTSMLYYYEPRTHLNETTPWLIL